MGVTEVVATGRAGAAEAPTVWFTDRAEAGRRLARRLESLRGPSTVVLGVGAGGGVVAEPVALRIGAPLDVVVVEHVARPFQRSVALAAVAEDGVLVVDDAVADGMHIGLDRLAALERPVRASVDHRAAALHRRAPAHDLTGATAVVVADGIVTGLAARAVVRVARRRGASRVVIAAPVVAASAVPACRRVADDVVRLACPPGVPDVRRWYGAFPAVTGTGPVTAPGTGTDVSGQAGEATGGG